MFQGEQTVETNQPCFSNEPLKMLSLGNRGSDFRVRMTTINESKEPQRLPAGGCSLMEHLEIQMDVSRRNDPSYQGQPISRFPPHPAPKTQ